MTIFLFQSVDDSVVKREDGMPGPVPSSSDVRLSRASIDIPPHTPVAGDKRRPSTEIGEASPAVKKIVFPSS